MLNVQQHRYPLTDAEKAVLMDRSPREHRFTVKYPNVSRTLYLMLVMDRYVRLLEAQARRVEQEIGQ